MTRKKKRKNEADKLEHDTNVAATMALGLIWALARDHELCPICVLHMMVDMVREAESKGHIEHGVLHEDDGIPAHRTIQ